MTEAEYVAEFTAWRRLPDGRFLAVYARPFNTILIIGRWLSLAYDDQW